MQAQEVVDAGDALVLLEDEVVQRVDAAASAKREVAEEEAGGAVVGVVVAAGVPFVELGVRLLEERIAEAFSLWPMSEPATTESPSFIHRSSSRVAVEVDQVLELVREDGGVAVAADSSERSM